MAKLDAYEQQLANDFFLALKKQGLQPQDIETILKASGPTIVDVAKAIAEAAKTAPPIGVTVSPNTELRQERLSPRDFEALKRSLIGNFGILQCLSPDDIVKNCRTIGPKTIVAIQGYATRHSCRLRGREESAKERIREIFGSIKAAPAILAAFLEEIDMTLFDKLCKQYSVKKLGDFRKVKRSAMRDTLGEYQAERLEKFLGEINVSIG